MALFDPPGGGPKIAILGALRCRVRGGWGGSAHYPDPTAQSAPAARRTRKSLPPALGTRPAPVRTVPGPRSPRPAGRPRLCLLGWLILRPLRGGVVKVAAAPFGVGDPRPGTRVPSRARG